MNDMLDMISIVSIPPTPDPTLAFGSIPTSKKIPWRGNFSGVKSRT